MRLTIFLVGLLIFAHASYAISINEIMYNPAGDDDNNEWIELYNNESISYNISSLVIGDLSSNDSLTRLQGSDILPAGGYVLIGESGINLSLYPNATVFSAGAAIGNSLGNADDTIFLFYNNSLLDSTSYSSAQGGNENGKTLCRMPDAGPVTECTASPAVSNTANQDAKLEILLSNITLVNQSYTQLFRIEIDSKDCSVMDNVTVSYNITNATAVIAQNNITVNIGCTATDGQWTPDRDGNFTLCGIISNTTSKDLTAANSFACKNIAVINPVSSACNLALWIDADPIINAGSLLNYKILVNDTACGNTSHSLSIHYWIEDLFGKIERNDTTEQSMTCSASIDRQWTPDSIEGSEAFMIKANITDPYCTDTNSSNNFNTKLVVAKGSEAESEKESYINITDVDAGSDNTAEYGEPVDVSVEIYRNSTAKYAIDAWIRDSDETRISEIATIHANKKLATYTLKIPIQLKPNCDGAFADGEQTVVFDGLGTQATAQVNVSDISSAACKTITVSGGGGSGSSGGGSSSTNTSLPYEIISYPNQLHVSERFFVRLRIINNANAEKNFSAYSYVYKDNTPVSLGLDNGAWSGEWTANKKKIKLSPKAYSDVNLESMIEGTTHPGKYKLNVRLIGDKEYDFTREVDILPAPAKPNLTVKASGKLVRIESNCADCSLWVLPEDIMLNVSNASLETTKGVHYIMLLKQNEILEKTSLNISDENTLGGINITAKEDGNLITGFAIKFLPPFDMKNASKLLVFALLNKFARNQTNYTADSTLNNTA